MGLPVHVFSLYADAPGHCSDEMRAYDGPVFHLGVKGFGRVLSALWEAARHEPKTVLKLMREGLFRRIRDWESLAENVWCFFAGFALAEFCRQEKIELLHSPWANGAGTAAWIASRLTGIPFAVTGRAGDIYPPDGLLKEKLRDCLFARTNTAANVKYLSGFLPPDQSGKVALVYNGLTLPRDPKPRDPFSAPYRILAVGRLARTKGFDILLTAIARLERESFPCRLTLVGDGWLRLHIKALRRRLKLEHIVDMPGFVPHDHVAAMLADHHMLVTPSVVHGNGDRDGIPNVIMEALSRGMPVVASNVSGIGEVVRNGETGILIPQRDPVALAEAIRRVAENQADALRMGQNGRELVERMFDPETNTRQLFDLYVSRFRAFCGRSE